MNPPEGITAGNGFTRRHPLQTTSLMDMIDMYIGPIDENNFFEWEALIAYVIYYEPKTRAGADPI